MNTASRNRKIDYIGEGIIAGFTLALIAALTFNLNIGYSLSFGLLAGVLGGAMAEMIKTRRVRNIK